MFLPSAVMQDFQSLPGNASLAAESAATNGNYRVAHALHFTPKNKFISVKLKRPQGTTLFVQWEEWQNWGFRRMKSSRKAMNIFTLKVTCWEITSSHSELNGVFKFLHKALFCNRKDLITFQMNIPTENLLEVFACVLEEQLQLPLITPHRR